MGKTSSAMEQLFGDVHRYVALLEPVAKRLARAYREEAFTPVFDSLPHRSIAIAPMVLCDALAADLKMPAPELLLQAIGALCLHISTHDDLVDEPAAERLLQGARLYAGNIAVLEGMRILDEIGDHSVSETMLRQIALNHALQQRCLVQLWEGQPATFAEYRAGIEHDCAFASIGIFAALAYAKRLPLRERLWDFCVGYGVGFQLLDDIAETPGDEQLGYHSFPLLEGRPYAESFRQTFAHFALAESALDPHWRRLHQLVDYPRTFATELQHAITTT